MKETVNGEAAHYLDSAPPSNNAFVDTFSAPSQGGGNSSWLIYETFQLGVRRIWGSHLTRMLPQQAPDPNCSLFLVSIGTHKRYSRYHPVPPRKTLVKLRTQTPGPLQAVKTEFQGEALEAVF